MITKYETANGTIFIFSLDGIDARMYVIVSNKEALIIDPHVSEELKEMLEKYKMKEVTILLTHEHFDHISGINWLRNLYNCKVICSEKCEEGLKNPSINLSNYLDALLINKTNEFKEIAKKFQKQDYRCFCDYAFNSSKEINWSKNHIKLIETPGHSKGSICIILNENIVFTGDSLVNGFPIITRLPGGSKKEYVDITLPFLKSLPMDTLICPGHGEPDVISKFNF